MSAGFTPGPWSVGPSHVVAQRSTDGEGRRTTRFVAEALLSTPLVEGDREANAHLIAAAPELYDAGQAALMLLQNVYIADTSGLSEDSVVEALITALAKARGEA